VSFEYLQRRRLLWRYSNTTPLGSLCQCSVALKEWKGQQYSAIIIPFFEVKPLKMGKLFRKKLKRNN